MREITYLQALNEALKEEMTRDESVVLIGEDVGVYGGAFAVSRGLLQQFGERRIIDTPISEAAIVGAGIGAALTGIRPVVEIMFIDFATIAMDQIVNQAAKLCYMYGGKAKVPLVIRMPEGVGKIMAAQHSQSLEVWFAHIPGLKVVMPSTPYDAKGLLKAAIRDNNPVIFIEHKMLYSTKGMVPEGECFVPLGKGDIKREGKDFTIIATSRMVGRVMEAAVILEQNGVSVEVIDPRTLVPLDEEIIIESVKKTGYALIVQEAYTRCGMGCEFMRVIVENVFDYLDSPVKILGGMNIPVPFGKEAEEMTIPQTTDIVTQVKKMLNKMT